ncbi:MAG: HIT domain-containing protein [Candidatus Omnitrophota bacterium]
MNNLWAPWRNKYITRLISKKEKGCFICKAFKEKGKEKNNLVIHRGQNNFSMMNLYPYNNGHILICPNKHVNSLRQLNTQEITDFFDLTFKMKDVLDKLLKPHGYNIGFNIGNFSGAGIDHIHMHIVPRWKNDTNFMPVVGNTKVISQSIEELYNLLIKENEFSKKCKQSGRKTSSKIRGKKL